MDILKNDNLRKVFIEYAKSPSNQWVPIYYALTKNFKVDNSTDFEQFSEFKKKYEYKTNLFKKGLNPAIPNLSNPGFYHARHIDFDETQSRKHRLYINPQLSDRLAFVNIFLDKCIKNEIHFSFKFSRDNYRSDSFLIYSTNEQLPKYVKILKEIQRDYPDIINRCGDCPMSATSVNDFFAYGPENSSSTNDSLSSKTAKQLQFGFEKTILNFRNIFQKDYLLEKNFGELLFQNSYISQKSKIINSSERDIYFPKVSLREEFIKAQENMVTYALNQEITDEQIENDATLFSLSDGKSDLQISPSAIC